MSEMTNILMFGPEFIWRMYVRVCYTYDKWKLKAVNASNDNIIFHVPHASAMDCQ